MLPIALVCNLKKRHPADVDTRIEQFHPIYPLLDQLIVGQQLVRLHHVTRLVAHTPAETSLIALDQKFLGRKERSN